MAALHLGRRKISKSGREGLNILKRFASPAGGKKLSGTLVRKFEARADGAPLFSPGGGAASGWRRHEWTVRFAAHLILHPQTPHHDQGFSDDMPRHFGMSLKPVGKNDRHLNDPHATPPEPMGHFDLETVPI